MTDVVTAEETAQVAKARELNQLLLSQMGTSKPRFVTLHELAAQEPAVTATVPREFTLTLDDHQQIKFTPGTHEVPLRFLTHWYVASHGVKPYFAGKAAAPPAAVEVPAPILGSKTLGDQKIGDATVPIGEFEIAAYGASGMTIGKWNALSQDDRDMHVLEAIERRRKAAEAPKAADGKPAA